MESNQYMKKVRKAILAIILVSQFIVTYLAALILTNKKKRVMIIAQNTHVGGTHTFLVNLISTLLKQENKITLVVPESETQDSQWEYFKHLGINIVTYKTQELPKIEYWYGPKHILRFYFAKDVINQLLYFLRLKIKTKSGTVVVSSAYPCSFLSTLLLPHTVLYFIHSMPWGKIDGGNKCLLKIISLLKRKILTVSEYAKQRIINKWSIQEPEFIRVIYNAVKLPSLNRAPLNTSTQLHIVTCGNVLGVKNPFMWIEIAKKVQALLPEVVVSFTWCGKGPFLAECKERTHNLPNIQFLGQVNNVFEILQQATIYFQPSLWESHGLAVVEAMAVGVPCIVTNEGGTAESIIDGYNGYTVDVSNEDLMVEKIVVLLQDEQTRHLMSERSIERYHQLFSLSVWETNFNLLKLAV